MSIELSADAIASAVHPGDNPLLLATLPPKDARALQELVREGIKAKQAGDSANWRLGDLALEVETTYGGEQLQRYGEAIGVEYDSLREYRRVAASFESASRVADLPWSHHRVVAGHPEADALLACALAGRWSVEQLRVAPDRPDRATVTRRMPPSSAQLRRGRKPPPSLPPRLPAPTPRRSVHFGFDESWAIVGAVQALACAAPAAEVLDDLTAEQTDQMTLEAVSAALEWLSEVRRQLESRVPPPSGSGA